MKLPLDPQETKGRIELQSLLNDWKLGRSAYISPIEDSPTSVYDCASEMKYIAGSSRLKAASIARGTHALMYDEMLISEFARQYAVVSTACQPLESWWRARV